jgi:membrane-associated tyrosine/threonine-specific cdc2-inhibitory kinase
MPTNSAHLSPKTRPRPVFFTENATFSTKKEKETPKMLIDIYPPKQPIKSCPPMSRLRPHRKHGHDGARVITFLKKDPQNDSDIVSKHYDEKQKYLFFQQCFIIEGSLGCGSFGKVYRVKSKEDQKYYAIKKSKEKFKGHSDRIRKLEEVAKHEQLPAHPNFVKFYRAWEERQRLYIQEELCQMSLSAYAEKHHDIPESTIWKFIIDLLQACKHLHDRSLVHMDIKPDNIFISFDGVCKLGDFGLVIDLKNNDLKEVQEGDPKYLAPEVLLNNNNITCAADIFSLGMTFLELATDLDLPRGGDLWHQLRNKNVPSDIISSLSDDLVEIIMKMIETDHLKRATVDHLLNMPTVKTLIADNKKKIFYSNIALTSKYVYTSLYKAMWYFVTYPWLKVKQLVKDGLSFKSSKNGFFNEEKAIDKNVTSTPKKLDLIDTMPLVMMQTDSDDSDNENDYNQNSICSVNNNSYLNPLIDLSSSSLSDQSEDCSITKSHVSLKKARTEPTFKLKHANLLKLQFSPTSTTASPSIKPSPWKAKNLNPTEAQPTIATSSDTTQIGPTRLKLVFEDEQDTKERDREKLVTNKSIFTDLI